MPKGDTIKVVEADLMEHPAVRAWSLVQARSVEPERVQILKEGKKSAVYRLAGVGPRGSAVIAKRCRQATAKVERTIYEEVLPRLSLPGLQVYGFAEEAGADELCWLFLEDAGEGPYSPGLEEHRTLAARWLGTLHGVSTSVPALVCLPDRGPDHYLQYLRTARDNIGQNLANPALQPDDRLVLTSILSQLDRVESRWSEVEGWCDGMPRSLIHGDFSRKNLRIRSGRATNGLFVMDWETSGWGFPGIDLAQTDSSGLSANPSLSVYGSSVRYHWPALIFRDIKQMANIGKTFRCLAGIHWSAWGLAHEWVERPMRHLSVYESNLTASLQAAGRRG